MPLNLTPPCFQHVGFRRLRAWVAVVLVVSYAAMGCGGQSSGAHPAATAAADQGTAAGEAFVCIYDQVPHKAAPILVIDFQTVLKGISPSQLEGFDRNHACNVAAIPSTRMSPVAAAAATAIVKRYADQLAQQLGWTQSEITELQQHGL